MEDVNQNSPLFKKIDKAVFEKIDKFKLTPGYNNIQDFYNGLEEDQQKVLKGVVIVVLFMIPVVFLGLIMWQNNSLRADLETRMSLISKANQIIGERQSLRDIAPSLLSSNPIEGESMMTSRLSNLLSSAGVDLSKIQVTNYSGNMISSSVMRSEADFKFSNLSTDELMNLFSSMIQREKFRIESVEIVRNAESNLLQGQFHAIHFSNVQTNEED